MSNKIVAIIVMILVLALLVGMLTAFSKIDLGIDSLKNPSNKKKHFIISSYLLLFSQDPYMFQRLSLSSDHEPEGIFYDEYLCSNRFPVIS